MYVGIRGDASSALTALKQTQEALKKTGAPASTGPLNNVQGGLTNLTGAAKVAAGAVAALGLLKLGKEAAGLAWDLGMTTARVHEMNAVLRVLAQNNNIAESAVMAGVESVREMGIETQVAQDTMAQFTRYQMDSAKAADLARVAQDAAVLSGQNSSEAMAGLIYGITTYNQRVIRTYGLNVDMSSAFDTFAASVGKTAEELTEAEKVSAALNGVLAEGTRITGAYAAAMEEPGKRWRSLPRYVNEIKVALGEAFLPVVEAAADGLTNMSKAVLDNADAFTAALEPIGDAAADIITFATNVGEAIIQSVAAEATLQAVNDQIAAMGTHARETTVDILGLRRGWDSIMDIPEIQEGIAFKMERTADAAAYMSRNTAGAFDEMRRLADDYAEALERADRVEKQGGIQGKVGAAEIRTGAMLKYNQAVWEYAKRNGIATNTVYDLITAEGQAADAANALEDAHWDIVHANQQVSTTARAMGETLHGIAGNYRRAGDAAAGAARQAQYFASIARPGAVGRAEYIEKRTTQWEEAHPSGGGPSAAQQRFEREATWERDRVTSAKRAALEIRYWEQDQNEWIADNAASLTPELQAEFAARTAAAKAEAEQIKETDAGLARDLLSAEQDYQQEKAQIAADESLSDEERVAKMAILERENAETVERAKETAALEAQIREEERQREISQMQEAGAAGGKAMVDAFGAEWDRKMKQQSEHWTLIGGAAQKSADMGKPTWGTFLDGLWEQENSVQGKWDEIQQAAITAGQEAQAAWTWLGELTYPTPPARPGGSGGGGGGYIPEQFAAGGIVPGPVGMPRVAIVHGGETITPPGGRDGGITVLFTGPVYATSPQQAQRAGEDMGRGIRMAAKSGGIAL